MPAKVTITQRKALWNRSWLPRPRSFKSRLLIGFLATLSVSSLLLLCFPYLPHLGFLFRHPKIDATPYHQAAQQTIAKAPTPTTPPVAPPQEVGNRLVLPTIGVNSQIIEGKNIYVIGKNQGVWHETKDVNPTKPGNMVIAGHRFLYTAKNGGYFYNLPELKNSDRLYVKWDNKVYEYEVYNTKTVLPNQIDIRNADPDVEYKLTMYTCYPLGSTAKRFVIEAKQVR